MIHNLTGRPKHWYDRAPAYWFRKVSIISVSFYASLMFSVSFLASPPCALAKGRKPPQPYLKKESRQKAPFKEPDNGASKMENPSPEMKMVQTQAQPPVYVAKKEGPEPVQAGEAQEQATPNSSVPQSPKD